MNDRSPDLRALYAAPGERARRKEIRHLDPHCRRFIARAPFVVLASADDANRCDASPRGGDPGFVKVLDDTTLLIPDAPGNNRLDTLQNIQASGRIGLLFLIPGVDETLRVNGRARVSADAEHIRLCTNERRAPKVVIEVRAEEVYLHCAKALMRSRLWSDANRVERSVLPTMRQMIAEQSGLDIPPETQEEMIARYQKDL
ncbi:MAG TPA: pyridoxamine 5'-phosphate oxidase family protein [Burkholderiales bacterium]|nr:pyridoxamine 5'-phosphate oxidase family protein [Burkholderiales bacterium]